MIKITALGCLHGYYPKLEGGDLLIVTGDLTARDMYYQYEEFFTWLHEQEYEKKVFISGNHDNLAMSQFDWYDAECLYNSGTEYQDLKIWGSPNSVWFDQVNPHCAAFMEKESKLKKIYSKIPFDTNILITHTPPYSMFDENIDGIHCGSVSLRNEIFKAERYNSLKLNLFSHIHEQGGKKMSLCNGLTFANCSIMNEKYRPVNSPIHVEI